MKHKYNSKHKDLQLFILQIKVIIWNIYLIYKLFSINIYINIL
jgi:hypothetical protein